VAPGGGQGVILADHVSRGPCPCPVFLRKTSPPYYILFFGFFAKMCHCGRCNGCLLYKESVRRIARENKANLLRRKIPPRQMYADAIPVAIVPRWPGPAPQVRRVPNLFQRDPALRHRFPSPPRTPSKILNRLRDPEEEYFYRQSQIAEAERQRSLAPALRTPKKKAKPVALNPSPVQQKKPRKPRVDPLFSSVNYEKKTAYGNLRR